MTKVSDVYEIDGDELTIKAEGNEYWNSVLKFWSDIKDESIERLSPRQQIWLDKIVEGLQK